MSPSVSMTSPTSKPRMRRSTGGKSRESEEESADTRQKINLILEQAKQEAERSAAAQHLPLVPMPGYRVPEGGIPITALVSQASSPTSQEVLIDPKTGHTVRLSAPSSVTLTLVTTSQSEPRAAVITNTCVPRAGIPQPTVLPPRQGMPAPRPPVVATLPIQPTTLPLPPESVSPGSLLSPRPPPPAMALPRKFGGAPVVATREQCILLSNLGVGILFGDKHLDKFIRKKYNVSIVLVDKVDAYGCTRKCLIQPGKIYGIHKFTDVNGACKELVQAIRQSAALMLGKGNLYPAASL